MSREQHTVLGILLIIVVIRLLASGRIQGAWAALTNTPAAPSSASAHAAQATGEGVGYQFGAMPGGFQGPPVTGMTQSGGATEGGG